MNINNPTTFSAPDLTYTTSNASGTAGALRADDSIAIFSATVPETIAYGQSAGAGDDAFASRLDHVHGMAASDATPQATQAEAEAETNVSKYIPPDLLRYSPGVAKAWCRIAQNGTIVGSNSYPNSYNITSTSTSGTGDYTCTWADDFSQTVYAVETTCADAGPNNSAVGSFAVGSVQIITVVSNTGTQTILSNCVVAYGDQ